MKKSLRNHSAENVATAFTKRKIGKKQKIAIISVAILLLLALISGIITMFFYVSPNLHDGVNDDIRFRISYYEFDNFIFKNGDTIMPFRLKSPDKTEEGKTYPLAVFLHGGGSHGIDNIKQMYAVYIKNIEKYGEDCYVLMPQVPPNPDRGWDENMIETIERCLDEFVLPNYKIDESRIYLSGSSMGGYGTIQYLHQNPERYAAAMFDSGGIPWAEGSEEDILLDYEKLSKIPMLISHGLLDENVPIASIQKFVNNLHTAGASEDSVRLIVWPNLKHETLNEFYTVKENWDWLFSQRKPART